MLFVFAILYAIMQEKWRSRKVFPFKGFYISWARNRQCSKFIQFYFYLFFPLWKFIRISKWNFSLMHISFSYETSVLITVYSANYSLVDHIFYFHFVDLLQNLFQMRYFTISFSFFIHQYISLIRPPITENTTSGADNINKVEWKQVFIFNLGKLLIYYWCDWHV